MTAIDYVVRGDAGALVRGVVADGAQVSAVTLGQGDEVSFNLQQVDLRSYQRSDDNLVIELVDGRLIVIENYFNDIGEANRLFVSADGYLNEISFVETADGGLYGQYGASEQWGKWSPSDDLIYLGRSEIAALPVGDGEDVTQLAAGLLGTGLFGAGTAAAAVVGASLLDGGEGTGDDTAPADPFVNEPDSSTDIGGDNSAPHSITVTGGGEPGDTVAVTIGSQVVTTVIADDGTFTATFVDDDFPDDGNYEATVVVTDPSGGQTNLDGPSFVIDTTPPDISVTVGTGSVGDSHNEAGMAGGVRLSGTGEAGATVEVTIQGITRTGTVAQDGSWSLTWQAGVLADGEYTSDVTIVTRDSFGNSQTVTDTLVVDTVADVSVSTASIEGDGVINAVEHADGVSVSGTAQAGSSVVVTFGTGTRTVTADGDGNWTTSFTSSEVPTGETTAAITAVATDAMGNTATATGSVQIDTFVNTFTMTSAPGGADSVINAAEVGSGVVVSGQVEPGSTVMVQLGNVSRAATVDASGNWTATFTSADIPAGEYSTTMVATATDAAGNTSTLNQSVTVDTVPNALTITGPIEGDDIINAVEASDGVVLTGTSIPGAVVQVTMGNVTHTVTTGANGQWSSNFTTAEIPAGTYNTTITATSTDAAGNVNTVTDTVRVDTEVVNYTENAIETDNVVSGAERADGVTMSGTVEAGSTVRVTIGTQTVDAVVDANGNWTATFQPSQVPEGEYTSAVRVLATDAAGNVAEITDSLKVDTLVNTLNFNAASTSTTLEGDGTINAVEALDGVTMGGAVEPGSTVIVNFHGTNYAASVDAAGNWSLTIPPSGIPSGTYDANVIVSATDAVGNTDSISQVVKVDTDAPDGPVLASFTRDATGVRSVSTDGNNDDVDFAAVSDAGAITTAADSETYIAALDETLHSFTSNIPDGSDLILTASDSAGNRTSTYTAFDDENPGSTVSMGNAGLGAFQIEAVDLQYAEAATLTLTEAQILALSDTSNTLTVHGGLDDTVQVSGAVRTGSQTVDGQSYNTYDVGNATLIIDADITVEEPNVI